MLWGQTGRAAPRRRLGAGRGGGHAPRSGLRQGPPPLSRERSGRGREWKGRKGKIRDEKGRGEPPAPPLLAGCSARAGAPPGGASASNFPQVGAALGELPRALTAAVPSRAVLLRAVLPRAEPSRAVLCRASTPLPALDAPQPRRPGRIGPCCCTSRWPSAAIRRRESHSGRGGVALPCPALPCPNPHCMHPSCPACLPAPALEASPLRAATRPAPTHALPRSWKLSSFFPCVHPCKLASLLPTSIPASSRARTPPPMRGAPLAISFSLSRASTRLVLRMLVLRMQVGTPGANPDKKSPAKSVRVQRCLNPCTLHSELWGTGHCHSLSLRREPLN